MSRIFEIPGLMKHSYEKRFDVTSVFDQDSVTV